jgi:hypothetical protein
MKVTVTHLYMPLTAIGRSVTPFQNMEVIRVERVCGEARGNHGLTLVLQGARSRWQEPSAVGGKVDL